MKGKRRWEQPRRPLIMIEGDGPLMTEETRVKTTGWLILGALAITFYNHRHPRKPLGPSLGTGPRPPWM